MKRLQKVCWVVIADSPFWINCLLNKNCAVTWPSKAYNENGKYTVIQRHAPLIYTHSLLAACQIREWFLTQPVQYQQEQWTQCTELTNGQTLSEHMLVKLFYVNLVHNIKLGSLSWVQYTECYSCWVGLSNIQDFAADMRPAYGLQLRQLPKHIVKNYIGYIYILLTYADSQQ